MIRLPLFACAALLAGPALAGGTLALKASPTDADGVITLGDLFEGAGAAASTVVAAGPKPGASVVLDAARVQAAARTAGLQWANPSGLRRIAVRAGETSDTASAPSAEKREALVYTRSLNAGDVVGPEDLAWAPVGLAPSDAPRDADLAIGMAAKKPVRAGSAVSARDLSAPRVIAKDDAVSVTYRMGGVNLVLQGKAVTAAAAGETVRVMNPQSKKILEAVAEGPGHAVVGPAGDRLKTPSPLARR